MAEPETKKVKVAPAAAEGGESSGCAKKAIITGITGQDGSYLAEFLLEKVWHLLLLFCCFWWW